MIVLPDNIVEGLALLPQNLRQPNTEAWLAIYLGRYNTLQDVLVKYFNWLLQWDLPGADTPDFILDNIGKLLGQPRPDGAGRETYREILKIRRLVRLSSGTRPQVREIVKALGDISSGAAVVFMVPHTIVVSFANFSALEAKGFSLDVRSATFLRGILRVKVGSRPCGQLLFLIHWIRS
jgi:hypothetical protein